MFLKFLIDEPPFLIAFFKTSLEYINILLHSCFVKSFAFLIGLILELNKISLAYIFPIPETNFWSSKKFLIFFSFFFVN